MHATFRLPAQRRSTACCWKLWTGCMQSACCKVSGTRHMHQMAALALAWDASMEGQSCPSVNKGSGPKAAHLELKDRAQDQNAGVRLKLN
eukprot:scaffold146229_cov19-Tisochrysis_lutea.AAC.3